MVPETKPPAFPSLVSLSPMLLKNTCLCGTYIPPLLLHVYSLSPYLTLMLLSLQGESGSMTVTCTLVTSNRVTEHNDRCKEPPFSDLLRQREHTGMKMKRRDNERISGQ